MNIPIRFLVIYTFLSRIRAIILIVRGRIHPMNMLIIKYIFSLILNEIGGTNGLKILTSHYSSLINATNHDLYCLKIMLDLIDVSEIPSNLKKIVKENDLKKCLISLIKTSQEEGNAIAGDPTSIAKAMTLLIKEIILISMIL